LRRTHVHSAAAVDPSFRREGEAESGAQHPRRQACDSRRRLDRARDDEPEDRADGACGRREGSARAHQLPAHDLSLFLWRRHAAEDRTDCRDAHDRPDPRLRRGRQHRLSEPRRSDEHRADRARQVLQLVLHRELSRPGSAGRGALSSAGVETGQERKNRNRSRIRDVTGRCDAVFLRVLCSFLCVLVAVRTARAQEPSAPQTVTAAQLQAAISKLGDLNYETRATASRTVRRTASAQAVPALMQAVAEQPDGYVRYRSLVLLTGFNDPRTIDSMRESLASPNDRLRIVAYSFF